MARGVPKGKETLWDASRHASINPRLVRQATVPFAEAVRHCGTEERNYPRIHANRREWEKKNSPQRRGARREEMNQNRDKFIQIFSASSASQRSILFLLFGQISVNSRTVLFDGPEPRRAAVAPAAGAATAWIENPPGNSFPTGDGSDTIEAAREKPEYSTEAEQRCGGWCGEFCGGLKGCCSSLRWGRCSLGLGAIETEVERSYQSAPSGMRMGKR